VGNKVVIKTDKNWSREGKIIQTGIAPRSYLVETNKGVIRKEKEYIFERINADNELNADDDTYEESVGNENSVEPDKQTQHQKLEEPQTITDNDHHHTIETENAQNNSQVQSSSNIASFNRRSSIIRKINQNPDYEYY